MKSFKKNAIYGAIASLSLGYSSVSFAGSITDAITSGTASGNINLRYESVDNDVADSNGLTLRTRLGYKTGEVSGFSAYLEFEDVTDVLGIDDEDGLIPDPEVTEVEQGYLQYKGNKFTTKLGRQVLTLDGHRFVGHVGWRQDRQTFDALRFMINPSENLSIDLSHIYQRNRIFGEAADADSSDILANISYKTSIGKIVGYGYFLDDETRDEQSDTIGFSLNGSIDKFLYHVEYASQEITDSGAEFDTDYTFIEGGIKLSGVTLKLGYEVLGSDDGAASFTTPLATLHKFNGWADVFLGGTFNPTAMPAGLEDMYFSAAGKFAGVKIVGAYHTYSANEGDGDYGSEFNLLFAKAFSKNYSGGLKLAAFSGDDGANDVQKIWLWTTLKF